MGDARSHSKGAPRSRQSRVRVFAVLLLAATGAAPLLAQCSGAIPNFRVVGETPGASITLAWDPPGGAPPGTTYEIVRTNAPGYCSISGGGVQTFTTTSTTYTALLDVPSAAYTFTVRLLSDPSVTAGCQYASDTFPPPLKPNLAGASPTPGQADLTFSYPSETAYFSMQLFRGTTAASQPDLVTAPSYCPAGTVYTLTDYGPGGSASTGGTLSGPYFYRLYAYNFGSGTGVAGVPSDLVSINVIGACSAPDAPRSPSLKSAANPSAPVTGTDFLAVSWLAPSSGQTPSGYEYRINGDPFTAAPGLSATAPPRGTNDPITLTVRARACTPSIAGPEVSSSVVAPVSPGANFSFTAPAQATRPITFTDTSSPQATSWLWLFDDGTSETVQSPTHTFGSVGVHQVALIASNGSGSSVKVISINVLAASASIVTASRERQAFDATDDPGRRRLTAVRLRGEGHTLVALRSLETEDAVVYLRFLDRVGNAVLERRLVAPTGSEATQDIGAYGLSGEYTLEVVMSGRVVAALISDSAPQRTTRPLKRAVDEN
jgi:PKD repeat protein